MIHCSCHGDKARLLTGYFVPTDVSVRLGDVSVMYLLVHGSRLIILRDVI